VFDKKPGAIVTASPGRSAGSGQPPDPPGCGVPQHADHAAAEAYLGHVSDESFGEDGCLKDGPLKESSRRSPTPSRVGCETILRSRQLLAEDAAPCAQAKEAEPA
jgi:chromate reductase